MCVLAERERRGAIALPSDLQDKLQSAGLDDVPKSSHRGDAPGRTRRGDKTNMSFSNRSVGEASSRTHLSTNRSGKSITWTDRTDRTDRSDYYTDRSDVTTEIDDGDSSVGEMEAGRAAAAQAPDNVLRRV